MLRVLDTLVDYETHTTEHFVVRMHPSDAGTLWPYLAPLLEESWKTLTKKYDFKPQSPILVEVFQDQINDTYGTKFKMPVVYYSTLMAVAYGRSAKDAALDGQVIKAKKLEEIAAK